MALTAETRIITNEKARTQYLTIPAVVAEDSAYPFKDNKEVSIEIFPDRKELVVRARSRSQAASKRK